MHAGAAMNYRINQVVIYNPDDGTLKLIEENDQSTVAEISLAPTANRLLSTLIAHQGSVLERDELLEKVWDNFGLKASNNSLNQYVSMLRRNFVDLGITETAIVTVPKVGFMFSHDLTLAAEQPEITHIPQPQLPLAEKTPTPEYQPSAKNQISRNVLIAAALLFITLVNIGWVISRSVAGWEQKFEPRYLAGRINGCPVYSFYQTDEGSHMAIIKRVSEQLQSSALECTPGSDIYFRLEDIVSSQQKPVAFISVCNPLSDNRYAKCQSSYSN